MTGSNGGTDGDNEPGRPAFRGCIFCYSAEWAIHAGRELRNRAGDS